MTGFHRTYDHRLKEMIVENRNPGLFPSLKIPRSTARGWIKKGIPDVVTLNDFDKTQNEIILENENLKRTVKELKASYHLSCFTFKLFGLQIQYRRLPFAAAKSMLLCAIEGAKRVLPLKDCLHAIGLSSARFHSWRKREIKCQLEDATTCPRLSPMKISLSEISKIRYYASHKQFAHFSITALSWFTKKTGDLFASPATWSRTIKTFNIRRPTERFYPPKPKVGIRASKNNELWHLDLTIIRLTNNTRAFIQSVIDNYSRFVLATSVSLEYGGKNTKSLLEKAISKARTFGYMNKPHVLVDSGSENVNQDVNSLVTKNILDRTIAQIDISFSNSMIEAFFRRLKHAYLYLQKLTDLPVLTYHANYYVVEHNEAIPHSALMGATPLEVYSGNWTNHNHELLQWAHRVAITQRLNANHGVNCGLCPT